MSCPRCGGDNLCQMESSASPSSGCVGNSTCWCFQVPVTAEQRAMLPASSSCYCAACLAELIKEVKV